MRVTVNAGGREVTIETQSDQNITHGDLADKALAVWRETAPHTKVGFSAEPARADTEAKIN